MQKVGGKMYYVIYARKTVMLMVVLVLIGLTFWFGFFGDHKQVSMPDTMDLSQNTQADHDEDIIPAIAQAPRIVSELENNVVVSVTPAPTKFVEYRIEREKQRSQQLEYLEKMLETQSLSDQQRYELQKELLVLLDNIAKETDLENLLKANGYLDAVVLIENNSVTVVVPVTLTVQEAEIIGELVHRITNVRLDRITIIDELSRG